MDNEIKKKKRPIFFIIPALAVIAFLVKYFIFSDPFLYAGTVETTKVDVPSRVSSVISVRNVKEGDHIKKGDLLMHLSCEDYLLAQEIATRDFVRTDKLFRQGSQPQEMFDQMKNRKDDADLKVGWCDIRSPLNGVVLDRYHEVGEMVAPGTRLFTLANLKEDLYAYIYVPQTLVAKISLGEKLGGFIPELGMKEFSGVVSQVGDEAEFTPKNVQTREERTRLVYAIKVSFDNPDEILKPGMTIEVKIPESK